MNRFSISIFFLLSMFYIQINAQPTKNTLQENNLKGNVKSVTETEYGTVDVSGKIEKESDMTGSIVSTYNRSGNIIEQKIVDSKGVMGFKTVYEYQNNLKTREISYNSKNKVTERWVATYNDKGEINEAYRVFEGRNIEKVINTYDHKGNLLEETWYLNDFVYYKRTYTYSDNHKTVEIKSFDSLGNNTTKEIAKYNAQGILLEESKSNIKDSSREKTVCVYNEKEQLTEEQNYNSKNIMENKTVYVYDDKGNVIEENWYDNKNKFTTRIKNTYTFDSYGNWTEKIEYDTEIKTGTIYKRKITYYD